MARAMKPLGIQVEISLISVPNYHVLIGLFSQEKPMFGLENGDTALIVSIASAIFTFFSVVYARRLAVNDSERMKRKKIIYEVSCHHSPDFPGWFCVNITFRNLESVSAKIIAIKSKRFSSLKLSAVAFSNADGREPWAPPVPSPPSPLEAGNFLKVDLIVDAQGHLSNIPGSGPIQHFTCFANQNLKSSDLILVWEWGDGKIE